MTRTIPDLFVHVRGTHLHHLNYGIVLLSGLGAYLLFCQLSDGGLGKAALLYGAGMALTHDEFGMWLHLGGSYWQWASWDAVGTIAALLALVAFVPSFAKLKSRQGAAVIGASVAVLCFLGLLWWSVPRVEHAFGSRLLRMESEGPP